MNIWVLAYAASILGANVLIVTFGIIPIGFGLMAPAGVFAAGLSFWLRDQVHESVGVRWAIGAVVAGAALSALVSPGLALASGTAFLVSELADTLVYSPLRARGLLRAVVASNVVGMAVDSALFLGIAGFPMTLLVGLMVGKLYTILPAVAVIMALRQSRAPTRGALVR